jgi:hypothetical protein
MSWLSLCSLFHFLLFPHCLAFSNSAHCLSLLATLLPLSPALTGQAGAAVNAQCSSTGETPLHEAAKHDNVAVIELLLVRGADPDVRCQ